MTFYDKLVEDNLDVWNACLESEFITGLINETLPEECLKGYIIDDSIYLKEYCKVFSWAIIKSHNMEDVKFYCRCLNFMNEGEGSTRLQYLRRFGMNDEDIDRLSARKESKAYTDFMQKVGETEGAAEVFAAMLPCMVTYQYIFENVLKANPNILNTVYGPLVKDYTGELNDRFCKNWAARMNAYANDKNEKEKARLAEIFRESCFHELHFWEMSSKPR
ncbi:MAG: TENA/THI-4 family protein [Clostridia bacterium]|nr:TENA/THI-4 family protein [Clostridia bacterium]